MKNLYKPLVYFALRKKFSQITKHLGSWWKNNKLLIISDLLEVVAQKLSKSGPKHQ